MKVILFDGVCNLCNGLVNWVIDRDSKKQFYFSSLQSEYGQSVINSFSGNVGNMDSIVLVDGDYKFLRSEAVLRIFKHLGYPYKLLYAAIIVPGFIRNIVYNFVAANRYKWFGKSDNCRVPIPELKARFIE